jgi:AAA+ superfamily predicted ATPase
MDGICKQVPKVLQRKAKVRVVNRDLDKNDMFILKKCAGYMIRLFQHYAIITEESMNLIQFILRNSREELTQFVIGLMTETEKIKYGDDLKDQTDQLSFSRELCRILPRFDRTRFLKVESTILRLLVEKKRSLSYKGLSNIEKRMRQMRKSFGLNSLEVDFVLFFFMVESIKPCNSFFSYELNINEFQGRKYLIKILGINYEQMSDILGGILSRAGIIKQFDNNRVVFDEYITSFIQSNTSRRPYEDFFKRVVNSNVLPLECHLVEANQTQYVLKLLKEKPKTSTHILFYGAPGTGKTSYAYGIARKLGIPTYEIERDKDNRTSRRRASIVSCLMVTNHNAGSLIIVDEADNILNTAGPWFMRGEPQDKGWLNGLMEEPGTRIIWIVNEINEIDNSVMRRFAFSIHFKRFSRRQRIHVWETVLSRNRAVGAIGREEIESLAGKYHVSAGVIDMAVKKAFEVVNPGDRAFKEYVIMALNAHLTLLRGGEKLVQRDRIETNYSMEGLNVEGNLLAMMSQLENFDGYLRQSNNEGIMNMNLLYYGPPGTGKSELARYIASKLRREMICKRASDILDPFVGISERNICSIFTEAEVEGAVLVIDEVDTLLFSRNKAVHSWEFSLTNEFLTQMERYRGILICTTNRLEDLDNASIRRFSHKIGFKYLRPKDNILFYKRLLSDFCDAPLQVEDEKKLLSIQGMAPGDFRVVRDKFSFYSRNEIDHAKLIQALYDETAIRNMQHVKKRKIGF